MNHVTNHAQFLTTTQAAALRAIHRALSRGTEVSLFDQLAGIVHPDVINRFCDLVRQVEREERAANELSAWTVLYGEGNHFTCQAEDIHHAIEQCENAYPGENIVTAFEGTNESQVEVVHWDAARYGNEGTCETGTEPFVLGTWDRRGPSGQFDVSMAPAEGDTDDLMYAMFEVNRLPGSKDDSQCVHLHFDSETLAMSVFKQGQRYIVRPESGVSVLETTLPTGEKALIVQ